MDSLTRSLNYELPHDLHFDQYAQQMLENSKESTVTHASTPTITSFDTLSNSEFLKKFGELVLNSIQINQLRKFDKSSPSSIDPLSKTGSSSMDLNFAPNHVVIDSSSIDAMDELQKQLEYDKFMNEVWIGIVFTLILISMIFCICSCFLYHQFRIWKRNYHTTSSANIQCVDNDVEALKLPTDLDDPVPEYTLVSGLPSYEAALELLHKTPQSCLLVYPSVFNVFNKHEKSNSNVVEQATTPEEAALLEPTQQQLCETTLPLLSPAIRTTPTHESIKQNFVVIPIPNYAEAMSYRSTDEKSITTTATTSVEDCITHKIHSEKC